MFINYDREKASWQEKENTTMQHGGRAWANAGGRGARATDGAILRRTLAVRPQRGPDTRELWTAVGACTAKRKNSRIINFIFWQ